MTDDYFSMAVLYRYIQLHFDEKIKEEVYYCLPLVSEKAVRACCISKLITCSHLIYVEVTRMVTSLKETFTELVHRSSCSWFETWNVPAAIRKLQKMKLYTAYPIWLKDKNKLKEFYNGVRKFYRIQSWAFVKFQLCLSKYLIKLLF
jgi:hypothetical protein